MAEDVFGKDLSHLKGKTTRRTSKAIIDDAIAVPWELRNRKDIMSHINTICINGTPFLALIGYPIMFRMCSSMQGTSHEECSKGLDWALRKCDAARFRIKEISCDGEHRGMLEKV